MSFFTNLRADRLVTEIRSSTDPASPARQKAIARLKEVGAGAIEPILGALPEADKSATMALRGGADRAGEPEDLPACSSAA